MPMFLKTGCLTSLYCKVHQINRSYPADVLLSAIPVGEFARGTTATTDTDATFTASGDKQGLYDFFCHGHLLTGLFRTQLAVFYVRSCHSNRLFPTGCELPPSFGQVKVVFACLGEDAQTHSVVLFIREQALTAL